MSAGFDPGHRGVLTHRDLGRFPGETLFDRVGRVVCEAGCLPRKELYESWEVARRVHRRLRGGRAVELAAGHGLLAHLLVLLDRTRDAAIALDRRLPPSAATLHAALADSWPRLRGAVVHREADLDELPLEPTDLVVSAHACGALTDRVLDRALAVQARVAVLPCCHDEATCDAGGLLGFLPLGLAVDATRVGRLRAAGYEVATATIPEAITPQNRLLVAWPGAVLSDRAAGRG